METNQIFVAVISHKHGLNCYTSRSSDGLYDKLAEYCKDWWYDSISRYYEGDKYEGDYAFPSHLDGIDLIDAYFDKVDEEWYEIFIETLEEDE